MTILAALAAHYDRLAADGATPDYGYSSEGISFAIALYPSGKVADVADVRGTPDASTRKGRSKRPQPKLMNVPRNPEPRTGTKRVPQFLWDNAKYVLGLAMNEGDAEAAEDEHGAFCRFHKALLADTKEPALLALLRFLDEWQADDRPTLRYEDDLLVGSPNVVFRLDGERSLLHELPEARERWAGHMESASDDPSKQHGQCLVTGTWGALAKTHPSIKGVRGAQSSGASLVSFNFGATESHGKRQSYNSPVSDKAAFAYSAALNTLLRTERKVNMGGTTVVFWANATGSGDRGGAKAAEDAIWRMVSPPTDESENAKLADFFAKIASGTAFSLSDLMLDIDEHTRFHVLGLAPNAARLAVRFWWEGEVRELATRIAQHWSDLKLTPSPRGWPPTPFRLLCETAVQRKAENIPPTLESGLIRAIFTGDRYPTALLAAVLARLRTGGEHGRVNGLRAAICKACIARDHRLGFEKESAPMSLNRNEPNVAYQMGRLFAVLEKLQVDTVNPNATIKDRFFGSASSTPAVVFPTLIANGMKGHLPTLRKEKKGLAIWYENEMASILDQIESTGFPGTFGLQDQGRFAIGYYHEREGFLYSKQNAPTQDEEE